MYPEDDLLPLSKLADFVFCPRRAALHIIENIWRENVFTAEGQNLHQKTHLERVENRPGVRIVRGLRIHSFQLGLIGQADVVEFHRAEKGVELKGANGLWQPLPVEYKRGLLRNKLEYKIQLCAQALCLEGMLNCQVLQGALFYGKSKRRYNVDFDSRLRERTTDAAVALHRLFESAQTPKAKYNKRCKSCSLYAVCMPKITSVEKDIEHYLSKAKEGIA